MKKLFLLTVIILAGLSVSATALTNVESINSQNLERENVTLESNQEIEWGDNSVEYQAANNQLSHTLTVYNSRNVIIEQYFGDELFSSMGETKKITDSLYLRPNNINYDDESLEATVWTKEEFLGSSEMEADSPAYIVKQVGEKFSIPLTVSNNGGLKETYELSTNSNSSLSSYFTHQGYNITKLVVEPGEEKAINANIEISDEAPSGMHQISFIAHDRSRSEKKFNFQVINNEEETRSLRMNLDQTYLEKNADTTFENTIRVENIGESKVEDVSPSISVPENWNYTLTPEKAENISSEEFQDFELEVSIPSTTSTGDYFIDIGLENTEDFDSRNLRVNVSDSSGGFGMIGGALALIAILLVATVYKVFGRR